MAEISGGAAGEVLAARFLRQKGCRILAANVRSRHGEIDIIALDGQYIAFVEVKTRAVTAAYAPREAVTAQKQQRIRKTAALFWQQHGDEVRRLCGYEPQPRFDVVEVTTAVGRPMEALEIDHILGAYEAGDLHAAF